MSALHASLTRELEVLIQRGARIGTLDLAALVDTYAGLAPSSHPFAGDPRRVDLDALVAAFGRLPPGFVAAPRVRLVARLRSFAKGDARGHLVLSDGTLLIECRQGLTYLATLTASLCVLEHERRKAHALFAEYGSVPDDDDALVTHMALAMGTDEVALANAQHASAGALVTWLTGTAPLPPITLQPDLGLMATEARAKAYAQRVVAALAEAGLARRPLHVWLGPGWIVDCLSPFARELRPALTHWAASQPPALGADLQPMPVTVGEDALYAIAYDLLRLDERVRNERADADRTVGIARDHHDDVPFEIVDLSRVELGSCDPRVSLLAGATDGTVLLRVEPPLEDTTGACVHELLTAMVDNVTRVTMVLEGMALPSGPGAVVQPDTVIHWAGEEMITFPELSPWHEDALLSFSDTAIARGAVVSTPSAQLLSAAHVEGIARRFRIAGVEVGHVGTLRGLSEAMWSGRLPRRIPVSLALVGTTHVDTGRASLQSIASVSALAVASLAIGSVAEAPPEPPPPVQPARESARPLSKPRSGRSVRIKA